MIGRAAVNSARGNLIIHKVVSEQWNRGRSAIPRRTRRMDEVVPGGRTQSLTLPQNIIALGDALTWEAWRTAR